MATATMIVTQPAQPQWVIPSWSSDDRALSKGKTTSVSWFDAVPPFEPAKAEKRTLQRAIKPASTALTFSFPSAPVSKPKSPTKKPAAVPEDDVWATLVDEAITNDTSSLELSRRGLKIVSSAVRDLRLMTKLDDGGPSLAEVKLYLSNNFLTASSISNALFMLHNLVVLSLRENDLDSLPAGIGRLAGLRELSIGGNRLTYLPAEVQNLQLKLLTVTPNPWLRPPKSVPVDAETHLMPLVTLSAVPSLAELCNRRLLQPCEPASPPLGSSNNGAFSRTSSTASVSGADAYGGGPCRVLHGFKGDILDLPPHLSSPFKEVMAIPMSGPAGFDPLAHFCAAGQSPAHASAPHEAVFITPVETRMQYTKRVAGVELTLLVPLEWRGCSRGCLSFLSS